VGNRNFLQDLQNIKKKLDKIVGDTLSSDEGWIIGDLREPIKDLEAMIDQCLEIQLAIMKEQTKYFFNKV
jgi:hypothetical protein